MSSNIGTETIGALISDVYISGESKAPHPPSTPGITDFDFTQWQIGPNGVYLPGSRTVEKIPSAVYRPGMSDRGLYFETMPILCDKIIPLPGSTNERVLTGIRRFWMSRDKYEKHGLLYKRGFLLYGPPGGGKTVTVHLVMQELIVQHGGVVLYCNHPGFASQAMRVVRAIEPQRPLVVVSEDIDEIIDKFGEHELLAMLDGEGQIDNVIHIATTNYPDRLGARIVNRPSRFDERIEIGMPSKEDRVEYLRKTTWEDPMPEETIQKWASDTNGMSIAHLRELVASVHCLGNNYEDAIQRLKDMAAIPTTGDGFRRKKAGFKTGAVQTNQISEWIKQ